MTDKVKNIAVVLLSTLSFSVYAQGSPKFECKEDTFETSTYFAEIQVEARRIDRAVCDAILVPTRQAITEGFPRIDVTAFGTYVKEVVGKKFKTTSIPNLDNQLGFFENVLHEGDLYPAAIPAWNVEENVNEEETFLYFFPGNDENQIIVGRSLDNKCERDSSLGVSCNAILNDLAEAINPYQRNANAFTATETQTKLNALSKEWDSYFEDGRTQSFFDIALTTVIERKHFKKDYLVGPPVRQWFAFHPNVVMEYSNDALDGDKFKPALSIEWFAVNWWEGSFLGVPFGVSLTSIYSDRPLVKGVGHGVNLYFDNKYMIGFADHDGDSGIYFSTDLLELFENKKKQADRFRNKIRNLRD